MAQDAQHKFFRLGVTSISSSDGHMRVMSATLLGPGDCAVIISNSGRTRDLMDAAAYPKSLIDTWLIWPKDWAMPTVTQD